MAEEMKKSHQLKPGEEPHGHGGNKGTKSKFFSKLLTYVRSLTESEVEAGLEEALENDKTQPTAG